MRKWILLLLLFLPLNCWGISRNSLKELARLIYESFPPVEGFVVGVRSGLAVVDLGARNKVFPGMVLTVSHKGMPFRNPITGQIIGFTEKVAGFLQILEVYPEASIGRLFTLPQEEIRPGDIVRITRARINLFLLPIVDATGEGFNILAFSSSLTKFLEETGRFNVLAEERVIQEVSAYKGKFVEENLISVFYDLYRDKLEAFFALEGRIEKRNGRYFFKGDLYCLNIAKKVRSYTVLLGEAGWKPSFEEDVLYVSAPVEGKGLSVAVGDVDGDGFKDIAVAVENMVRVATYLPDKRRLSDVGSFKVPLSFRIFNLDMADVDEDGRDEVIATGSDYRDFTMSSFIYKFNGKSFERKSKVDEHFVRALGGKLFMAQYLFKDDPLSIPPFLVSLKDYKLEKKSSINGLKGDLILGMAAFDADGDGRLDFVVNESGRVVVKNASGEVIADLPGSYGNTGIAFFYKEPQVKVFYEGEGFLEIGKSDYARFKELTLTLPGRIAVDAKAKYPKLVVYTNKPFVWGAFFDPFKSSTVKIFRWRNGYFEDTGWVRTLPEGVVDLALADVDNDGISDVVLLTLKGVKTRKKGLKFNTKLIIYKGSD